ncbi:MAG: hypothetical protein U0872_10000 [Planctomycetaceae bacterium]
MIPLLIDKADMPAVAALPETLHGLAYRNAAEFRAGRDSKNQLQLLMDGIDSLLKAKPKPARAKPSSAVSKAPAPSRLGPALDRVRASGRLIPATLGRWFASLRSRPPQPAWPSTLWIQSRKPLVFLAVLWGLAYLVGMVGFLMNNIDLPFIHLRSGPVGGLAIAFVTSAVLIFLVKRDSRWTAWLLYEIQVIGLWTCFTLGFLNSDTSDRSPANFAAVTFAWCLGSCLAFPILRGAQLWWQSLRERRLP